MIDCGGEQHRIGIDSAGCLVLLDHDIEEEETLYELGDSISECYKLVRKLESKPSTILVQATVDKDVELARLAIEHGADVHYLDNQAIKTAANNGDIELVALLIKQGANINSNGSALCFAVEHGHVGIVRLLLDNGAHVNRREHQPLTVAAKIGDAKSVKMARMLIDAGADVNAEGGKAMAGCGFSGSVEIARMLVDSGADVHARVDEALVSACWHGYRDLVRYLLDQGAVPSVRDDICLKITYSAKQHDILEMLVQADIDQGLWERESCKYSK